MATGGCVRGLVNKQPQRWLLQPSQPHSAVHRSLPPCSKQIFLAMVTVCLMLAADRAHVVADTFDGSLRAAAAATLAGQICTIICNLVLVSTHSQEWEFEGRRGQSCRRRRWSSSGRRDERWRPCAHCRPVCLVRFQLCHIPYH